MRLEIGRTSRPERDAENRNLGSGNGDEGGGRFRRARTQRTLGLPCPFFGLLRVKSKEEITDR